VKTFAVWIVALVAYAGFLGWYANWRGPLSATEVDALMADIAASGAGDVGGTDMGELRAFLADDDGREFYMLNLVRFSPDPVRDAATGKLKSAEETLAGYTGMFIPALMARGGHPAIFARKAGPFVDTWGVEPGPDWSVIGYMRYRSRRDLAELIADPRFGGAHAFKFAAMPETASFPTQPMLMALLSPIVWVGMALALVAALAQIIWLLLQGRRGNAAVSA